MDRELIEYFDRRFDESREEINRRFDETDRRFEKIDRRFDETDRRFDETDRRFDETDRRNEERFAGLDARLDELRHDMNDGLRHNRILIEDLTGKMELVIEGVVGFRQELKQDVSEVRGEVREVQTRLDVAYRLLDRRLKAHEAADA